MDFDISFQKIVLFRKEIYLKTFMNEGTLGNGYDIIKLAKLKVRKFFYG